MKIHNFNDGVRDQSFVMIDGEIYLSLTDLHENLEAFKQGLIEMHGERTDAVRVVKAIMIADSPEKYLNAIRE